VFPSHGQNARLATAHLNPINQLSGPKPWKISFSYGRALQDPALEAWHGRDENLPTAQSALYRRASAASVGKYTEEMEEGRHAPMIGRIVASGAMNNTCSRYALPFGHVEAFDDTESGEEDGKRFV